MKFSACLLLIPSLAGAAATAAPMLEAAVEGNAVVIYSSMKKAGGCKAAVMFSYRKGDGRETRKLECNFRVPGKEHHRFCEQHNPQFIDIKLEGPVVGGCE